MEWRIPQRNELVVMLSVIFGPAAESWRKADTIEGRNTL
jgi:hypothetical protein